MDAYGYGALGGALIGLGSLVAMVATGRIPGISGIFGRLLRPTRNEWLWRLMFLVGLIAAAAVVLRTNEFAAIYRVPEGRSAWIYVVAGLLVGFGTRCGGGCTSGHGVCGTSMGARNSMIATVTFMVFGMVTVAVFKQVMGA